MDLHPRVFTVDAVETESKIAVRSEQELSVALDDTLFELSPGVGVIVVTPDGNEGI